MCSPVWSEFSAQICVPEDAAVCRRRRSPADLSAVACVVISIESLETIFQVDPSMMKVDDENRFENVKRK